MKKKKWSDWFEKKDEEEEEEEDREKYFKPSGPEISEEGGRDKRVEKPEGTKEPV